MYNIEIANQQDLLEIDETLIQRVAAKTLEAEQIAAAEISVALVDDTTIHQLNRQHLAHDYPTDVLSFLFDCEIQRDAPTSSLGIREISDSTNSTPPDFVPRGRHKRIDGEIIVSTETAINKSAELECDSHHELLLYVIHGLLHLIGYDDLDDEERALMRSRERALLELCQLTPGVEL